MVSGLKHIISASRRTDIPAFYMDWFMSCAAKGYFEVRNPYNRRMSKVHITPNSVHTIVFWSKNFGPFLADNYGEKLQDSGYNLFFNFTLNSESRVLEPHLPPMEERLKQVCLLSERFGADCINWRFDPICIYASENSLTDNLGDFEMIAAHIKQAGIKRCITSFMDQYAKIIKRAKRFSSTSSSFEFIDPPMERKVAILSHMEHVLMAQHITLNACCEKDVLNALPKTTSITSSACISHPLLAALANNYNLSNKRDTGQRVKQGCGCHVSKDIGSYDLHPCFHNCLFCYANPKSPDM